EWTDQRADWKIRITGSSLGSRRIDILRQTVCYCCCCGADGIDLVNPGLDRSSRIGIVIPTGKRCFHLSKLSQKATKKMVRFDGFCDVALNRKRVIESFGCR